MLPIEGLGDERHHGGPPAAEDDGGDGDALPIFPLYPIGCHEGLANGYGHEAS